MQVYFEKRAVFGVKLRETPVVIVVSTLIAQWRTREAVNLGISAAQLCLEKENAIKNCRYQLLFGSPDSRGLDERKVARHVSHGVVLPTC